MFEESSTRTILISSHSAPLSGADSNDTLTFDVPRSYMPSENHSTEQDLIAFRTKKLEELKKLKINPYPSDSENEFCIAKVKDEYEELVIANTKIFIAGRIMAFRAHGGATFVDVVDESGKMQFLFRLDDLKKEYETIKLYDLGDFIEAEGHLFKTRTGEITLVVEKFRLLAKAIRPLPEQFYGLSDVETRYRERYVDLIVNPEVKEIFYKRSQIISTLRNSLVRLGFLEVDTPVLQPIPGGANAKPFSTHYNAYDRDVYLRIAPELYLKRLIVGGFERVFEFSRCFRNEGVDATHNPEFTNLEFYWAYSDYKKMMKLVEEMMREVVKTVNNGSLVFERDGKKFDFSGNFKKTTFDTITGGKNTDQAFKEGVKKIVEPTFVINHPIEISPLAKKLDDKVTQRFQLVIDGREFVNAFTELNDPIDQRERFESQMKLRKKGDEEAQILDEDFIRALEYGMPPTSGCGIGVDRLVMFLAGANTIREVLFFPYMRPIENLKSKSQKSK